MTYDNTKIDFLTQSLALFALVAILNLHLLPALLGGLLGGYALALPRNPTQPPAVTPSPPQTSNPTELRLSLIPI